MERDWREELQIEVMEDFLNAVRDPSKDIAEVRKHWEHLCGWIESFVSVERFRAQEKMMQDIWLRIEQTSGARGNYRSVEIIDSLGDYAEENGLEIVAQSRTN